MLARDWAVERGCSGCCRTESCRRRSEGILLEPPMPSSEQVAEAQLDEKIAHIEL